MKAILGHLKSVKESGQIGGNGLLTQEGLDTYGPVLVGWQHILKLLTGCSEEDVYNTTHPANSSELNELIVAATKILPDA